MTIFIDPYNYAQVIGIYWLIYELEELLNEVAYFNLIDIK